MWRFEEAWEPLFGMDKVHNICYYVLLLELLAIALFPSEKGKFLIGEVTMSIAKDNGVLIDESDEDLQRFFAIPSFIHYVGMLNPPRPGVADCFQTLEFNYFKPGTPRNHVFVLRVIEWQEVVWGVVSIPIQEKHLMEKTAQVNRLRVANGVPTMLTSDGIHQFPVSNERVFTLENIPGHPVYHQFLHR